MMKMNTIRVGLPAVVCILGLLGYNSSAPTSSTSGSATNASSPVASSPGSTPGAPIGGDAAAPMTGFASLNPAPLCPFPGLQDPHPQSALYRGKCMEGSLFAFGKLDRGKIAGDTVEVHYSNEDPGAKVSVKVTAAG